MITFHFEALKKFGLFKIKLMQCHTSQYGQCCHKKVTFQYFRLYKGYLVIFFVLN